MKPSKTYARLSQREDEISTSPNFGDVEVLGERGHGWSRKCAYIFLAILGGIICAVLGYVAHPSVEAHTATLVSSTSPSELHCGNSSMEARALGCVFDLLTNNWMPGYCSDPETDAEYRAWVLDSDRQLGAWAFFHDAKAEHRVASEQELSDLVGTPVYTTTENHLAHCAMLARRMHRLATGDIAAVAHNTFAHTMHCTSAILKAISTTEQPAAAQIGSTFDVGIVSCLV
jgi:hypothetical protein